MKETPERYERGQKGCPHKRFYENINKILMAGCHEPEAIELTQYRRCWRQLCNSLFFSQWTEADSSLHEMREYVNR